jgi:hypothetical protein
LLDHTWLFESVRGEELVPRLSLMTRSEGLGEEGGRERYMHCHWLSYDTEDRMQLVWGGQRKVMEKLELEEVVDHAESIQGPSIEGDLMGEKGSHPPPFPPH